MARRAGRGGFRSATARRAACGAALGLALGAAPIYAAPSETATHAASGTGREEILSAATPEDALQAIAGREDRMVAVGSKGLVLESGDGGRTFTRTALPGRPPLIDVTACADGAFWLLDFRAGLWGRAAPGEGWERQPIRFDQDDPERPARLLALHCAPGGRLWAVGEASAVLSSDDGGVTWTRRYPDRSDRLLTAVGFVGGRGRVVGEFGTYLESDDGGESWRAGPAIPSDFYPHAAHFDSDGRTWVVGNTGSIFRLDPGAAEWVREASSTEAALYGAGRVGDRLVAIGAGGRGVVRRRDAPEAPWTRRERPPRRGVARDWRGLLAESAHQFLCVGSAGLLRVTLPTAPPATAAQRDPS